MSEKVAHLVFDVESIADGDLISRVRYPDQNLSDSEAIATYQDELMEQRGTTFIPHTFQIPIAVVIAKVATNLQLLDIVSIDEPEFRPHVITENFWRGWEAYKNPQWVTFNGRSFDIPLMELAAFRFGISLIPPKRHCGHVAAGGEIPTHHSIKGVSAVFRAAAFGFDLEGVGLGES